MKKELFLFVWGGTTIHGNSKHFTPKKNAPTTPLGIEGTSSRIMSASLAALLIVETAKYYKYIYKIDKEEKKKIKIARWKTTDLGCKKRGEWENTT